MLIIKAAMPGKKKSVKISTFVGAGRRLKSDRDGGHSANLSSKSYTITIMQTNFSVHNEKERIMSAIKLKVWVKELR